MIKVVKYPPLKGLCKSCKYKCFRVEDPNFRGTDECKYADEPINEIKKILGIGEQIKI